MADKANIVKGLIKEAGSNGKFFTVEFVKKDGSLRKMNCRLGVTKHLKGGDRTVGDNYVVVYDMQKEGYRCINPETLQTINGIAV